eukprot:scaffold723_cov74-Phaeocystis_antarctica.AAC.2
MAAACRAACLHQDASLELLKVAGADMFRPHTRTAAALAAPPVKAPDNNDCRSRSSDEKAVG